MRRRIQIITIITLMIVLPLIMGPASQRTYVSGNYMLELDGAQSGFVKSVYGGGVYGEVINEAAGPDYFVRKHVGQPKYEAFELKVGFSMSKSVYDWIASSWKMNSQRKNGFIVGADYRLSAVSKREFQNALLTETTIPVMDASSKEPGYITIKFAPEVIRNIKTTGEKVGGAYGKNEQKIWLPSNFRLQIDGLDCSRVNKIDAFTVKQTVIQDDIGEARDYQREPGKLEFPNLKITLPVVSADDWVAWLEDFVIRGNNDQTREKNGTLTLLSPNLQEVFATIKLFNIGIVSINQLSGQANSDTIERYQVELYVERMEFEVSGTIK